MKEDYKYVWEKARNLYRVVLDSPSYDRETKKSRHHYVTVGKAFERNGKIDFGAKFLVERSGMIPNPDCELPIATQVIRCGERLVLNEASERTGLERILTETLGKNDTERILQLAYYWNCTGNPFSGSGTWFQERAFNELPKARISELLRKLTEEYCSSFIRRWVQQKAIGRKICYDITSVSTYAVDMDIAEFGHNRDHDLGLKQINLAMVTDQKTHLPLAFRQLRGSINDATTLVNTINEFIAYDAKPAGVIMDRGFWSEANMKYLAEKKVKFMIPVPTRVSWGKELIERKKNGVYANAPYVDSDEPTYWCTVYDPLCERRRAWAHIFYSPMLENNRKIAFLRAYHACKQELADGTPVEAHQKFYDAYFRLSGKRKDGRPRVSERYPMDKVLSKENFGYWILYTDLEKDAVQALLTYRDRNFIEVGFDDIKNSLDGRRLRVHSTEAVYGRLFIQFCAQILRTELRTMTASFSKETRKYAANPTDLLDRVRSITKIRYMGKHKDQIVALSKGQRLILGDLGLELDIRSDKKSAGSKTSVKSKES